MRTLPVFLFCFALLSCEPVNLAVSQTPPQDATEVSEPRQSNYQLADSGKIIPVGERVKIYSVNLDDKLVYAVEFDVVNDLDRYIGVSRIIDEDLGVISFPVYQSPETRVDGVSTYVIEGDPGTVFHVTIHTENQPITKIVRIEGPEDPELPPPTGDYGELTKLANSLVTTLNEADVQSALFKVFTDIQLTGSLPDAVSQYQDAQGDALEVLGSKRQIDKNWFDGFVVPIDQALSELVAKEVIKTSTDLQAALRAIARGMQVQLSTSAVSTPTITMYTQANCPECIRWKATLAPSFRKLGWAVEYKYDPAQATPAFTVCENGKCSPLHVGYMSVEAFRHIREHIR